MPEPPNQPNEPNEDNADSAELEEPDHGRRRLIDRLPGGSPGLRTPSPQDPIPGLRVPKERLRLAAVSLELPEALAVLADQVRRAENFLRRHPGTHRARVALEDVYLPDLHVGNAAFLETRRDDRGNCRIVVSYYQTESETCMSTALLDEFPIATRIELCKSVPKLIEATVAAQSLVATDVLTVASEIEDALERYRDKTI